MLRILLPVLMGLTGTGAGVGAGLFLAPAPSEESGPAPGETAAAPDSKKAPERSETDAASAKTEFVGLNNQFLVPILENGRIGAMVVLSLSIEVSPGKAQAVYTREPKLRDGFLRVLFDHANRGGFDGAFTNAASMDVLRRMLNEVARDLLGPVAQGVLITEIARQDT